MLDDDDGIPTIDEAIEDAEEDADIDAALNSLLDGTLGWAEGLEPCADSGEQSCAPGDGEATEGSDSHDNE